MALPPKLRYALRVEPNRKLNASSAGRVLGGMVEHMASSNGHHAGGAAKGDELNNIEQRRQTVAEMVASHYTYREIGDALGVASSTVSEDVKVIREQWRQRATADYSTLLAEELAKLDLLERELLPKALSGGPEAGVNLYAVDRVLAIRDRRARMVGLDAPQRIEVTARLELIAKAMIRVIESYGVDADDVRPRLAHELRELDAITEN
jgi:hypothetical protein